MSYQPPRPPFLVMRRGPRPNQSFSLHKDVLTIGRAVDNDIVVDDPEVSRHHARLTRRGSDWILEDLGSRNGTFVNGQRISGPVTLRPGSQVALGPDVLFGLEGSMAPARSAIRPSARKSGLQWLLLAGLAVLVVVVLVGAAVLAYYYVNPPVPESLDVAELMLSGPDIAFQEPAPGTQVGLGAAVLVFATARDEDKVTRVELWVDDRLVVQQDSPDPNGVTPLSLIHRLVATAPGTYALTVRAYDSLGAMGESPTLYVTVFKEPEPAPATAHYVVRPGDTPAKVAQVVSATVAAIQGQNPAMGKVITPGQVIVVPLPPKPAPPQQGQAPGGQQPKGPASGGAKPGGPAPGQPQPGGAGAPGGQPQPGGAGAPGGQPQPVHPPLPKPGQAPPGLMPLPGPGVVQAVPGAGAPGGGQVPPGMMPLPGGVNPATFALRTADVGDCTVTLAWDDVPNAIEYIILYQVSPTSFWHIVEKLKPNRHTYKHEKLKPGTYLYRIGAKVAGGRSMVSSLKKVVVPPSTKCIPERTWYKQVYFQPLWVEFKDPEYTHAALWVNVGDLTRRIPSDQGGYRPTGDWSTWRKEVMPAPTLLYLSDQAVYLRVCGMGFDFYDPEATPRWAGCLDEGYHPQSDLEQGGSIIWVPSERGRLRYRFWLESVRWTAQGTAKNLIPAPTNLRLAKNAKDLEKKAVLNCSGCDPSTTRVLLWDFAGDEKIIEGYILYRAYSCPGQDAQLMAPQVLGNKWQGIKISPEAEPVGCAVRYQVSAFGPAGESAASNPLDLQTTPAVSRVQVIFKELKLSKEVAGWITLQANQYERASEIIVIPAATALDLNAVPFYGKKPNNALTVNLSKGETLQVALEAGFCKLGKWPDPTKSGTYQLHSQSMEGECWATVEVKTLGAVSAGQIARPEADVILRKLRFIGEDIYASLYNDGPDPLSANKVQLKSYWVKPGTDEPLTPVQTITTWWPAFEKDMMIKVNSIKGLRVKDLSDFRLEVVPLDFDDPYVNDNFWLEPPKSAAQPPAQPAGQPPAQPAGQPPAQPAGQPPAQPAGQPPAQPPAQPAGQPPAQPGKTATRFVNNASLPVIYLLVDNVDRCPTQGDEIPYGGYREVELKPGTYKFQAWLGMWKGGKRISYYVLSGEVKQQDGVLGTVTLDNPTAQQLLTRFSGRGCWRTDPYLDDQGNMLQAAFCFNSDSTLQFYLSLAPLSVNASTLVEDGTYSQIGRDPSQYTVTFQVIGKKTGETFNGTYYELGDPNLGVYFAMANGPGGQTLYYWPIK